MPFSLLLSLSAVWASPQALIDAIEPSAAEIAALEALTSDPPGKAPAVNPQDGGLKAIAKTKLALHPAQLQALQRDGVVIADHLAYRSFGEAYEQIYFNDLPVFVSADSILHAMHRTYDDTLLTIERERLVGQLSDSLDAMLAAKGLIADYPPEVQADALRYLEVARGLLDARKDDPLVAQLTAAAGMIEITPWGEKRAEDASQFKPRGHYTRGLENYFRAMMWLGRVDNRLVTVEGGKTILHRRELLGAMALGRLSEEATRPLDEIDRVVGAFVGPEDSLDAGGLRAILAKLGATTPAAVAKLSDEALIAALQEAPEQRILSHLISYHPEDGPFVMPVSHLLLGQRYTVDSHVLSQVVYGPLAEKRMMPDPLDVAYAGLGNDEALPLLPGLQGGYAKALVRMRKLVDRYPKEYWEGTLYTRWVQALRTLSEGEAQGRPATEAWDHRVLNTQLASWAELRHDTILYAKQSYTAMAMCAFPDAWVEPNPAFWDATEGYATMAVGLIDSLELRPEVRKDLREPQVRLAEASRILGDMAVRQRKGEPFTAAQLAFVNDAVREKTGNLGCTTGVVDVMGWYPKLFLDHTRAVEQDPTIADVHTQPTDEAGNLVGKVLHVATANPRLMALSVETCNGPKVFFGPASRYHEIITEDFVRLDDVEWFQRMEKAPTEPWMKDLIVE